MAKLSFKETKNFQLEQKISEFTLRNESNANLLFAAHLEAGVLVLRILDFEPVPQAPAQGKPSPRIVLAE